MQTSCITYYINTLCSIYILIQKPIQYLWIHNILMYSCITYDCLYVHICFFRMLLHYAFSQLRSTQIATIHCSAQTTSQHLLQKLSQSCIVISTNTGRVYRPKDCERLVLYLKDINLPKPDKWGTSTLVAFLQQVSTYVCYL